MSSAHLCFFFLGADEDIESPELTTSRPLPKMSFTSAAPKAETTTLKIQNKVPAQTKRKGKTPGHSMDRQTQHPPALRQS